MARTTTTISQSTLMPIGMVVTVVLLAFGYGWDRSRLSVVERDNLELKERLKTVDGKLDALVQSSARVEARLGISPKDQHEP